MDSNCSESKILYFWDEHNIFIYIIPALVFILLLYPVLNPIIISKLNLEDIETAISTIGLTPKDLLGWPLVFTYLFIISCILYIVGNVIASLSTFILGKIVSIKSIGDPNVVSLTGLNREPFAVKLRNYLLLVDFALFILSLLFIFNLTPKIKITFIGVLIIFICLLVGIFIYIIKNIERDQNKDRKVTTGSDLENLLNKLLERIILGRLPDEVKEAFREKFKYTFGMKKKGGEKYDLGLLFAYMQENCPPAFFQIKRFHMLYSFSQNVTGSFLFALLFYISVYAFTDLSVSIEWWGLVVWVMGNIFLIRYLCKYYSSYYLYLVRAFVSLQSSKKKK